MTLLWLLPPFLLAAFAFHRWRGRRRQRERRTYIASYPYARHLDNRLARRRPELSPEQRALVFAALVDYFQICHQAGRRMVSMPSQVVDDAWHEFILFTRNYRQFCQRAFGRFLHHTPAEAMVAPTQASEGLKLAWQLACLREGLDPQRPRRLPRLFALDAQLGIAGGFVYQLDCLAAGRTGDGYCASHMGCAGGGTSSSSDGPYSPYYGSDTWNSDSSDSGGSNDSGADSGGSCGGGCGGGGGD